MHVPTALSVVFIILFEEGVQLEQHFPKATSTSKHLSIAIELSLRSSVDKMQIHSTAYYWAETSGSIPLKWFWFISVRYVDLDIKNGRMEGFFLQYTISNYFHFDYHTEDCRILIDTQKKNFKTLHAL